MFDKDDITAPRDQSEDFVLEVEATVGDLGDLPALDRQTDETGDPEEEEGDDLEEIMMILPDDGVGVIIEDVEQDDQVLEDVEEDRPDGKSLGSFALLPELDVVLESQELENTEI